jgi:hypothetical protein
VDDFAKRAISGSTERWPELYGADAGLTGDYGTLGLGGFYKLGLIAATMIKE